MAGSLHVGRYCLIGGASVINGHMEICDELLPLLVWGCDASDHQTRRLFFRHSNLQTNKEWRKTAALTLGINDMNKRLRKR